MLDTIGLKTIRVRLPATCGELVQGTLGGEPCLVSCPIGWYGEVEVSVTANTGWETPTACPKVSQAVKVALADRAPAGRAVGGRVRVRSAVPRGRGYGSSTVDVAGTLYGVGAALTGTPPDPVTVGRLAVLVEPTDSTLAPGLALFAHRTAAFLEVLGPAPALEVIVLDPGGEVDTEAFNRALNLAALKRLAPQHREAFALLRDGIGSQDAEAVGQAATISALAHQAVLPNPLVEAACRLARKVGALGVCRAHSGTLAGLLWNPTAGDVDDVAAWVARRLAGRVQVRVFPLVGGGPRFVGEEEQTWSQPWWWPEPTVA